MYIRVPGFVVACRNVGDAGHKLASITYACMKYMYRMSLYLRPFQKWATAM